mmetsp:Transcript_34672/g.110760  ORF Transcript_34672/g.110760 Transcript_34672/m.110760 type:complete len:467 (-) Transcript_34672:565-1965(-)
MRDLAERRVLGLERERAAALDGQRLAHHPSALPVLLSASNQLVRQRGGASSCALAAAQPVAALNPLLDGQVNVIDRRPANRAWVNGRREGHGGGGGEEGRAVGGKPLVGLPRRLLFLARSLLTERLLLELAKHLQQVEDEHAFLLPSVEQARQARLLPARVVQDGAPLRRVVLRHGERHHQRAHRAGLVGEPLRGRHRLDRLQGDERRLRPRAELRQRAVEAGRAPRLSRELAARRLSLRPKRKAQYGAVERLARQCIEPEHGEGRELVGEAPRQVTRHERVHSADRERGRCARVGLLGSPARGPRRKVASRGVAEEHLATAHKPTHLTQRVRGRKAPAKARSAAAQLEPAVGAVLVEQAQLLGGQRHPGHEDTEGGPLELDERGEEQRLGRVEAPVTAKVHSLGAKHVGYLEQVQQHVRLVPEPGERLLDLGGGGAREGVCELVAKQEELPQRLRAKPLCELRLD